MFFVLLSFKWVCHGETVVEHLMPNPKIKGLNPANGPERKLEKKVLS
jgi:hypothetical protein